LTYGQYAYYDFMLFRTKLLLQLLKNDIVIWLTESDAVWLKDPSDVVLNTKGDMVTMSDGPPPQKILQGGFQLLRPTKPTVSVWTKLLTMFQNKMSAAKKGKYVGVLNPNWKGNLVSDEVRERQSYIAKKWRKQVTKRDDHKCQKCGSLDKLHAHHIKEFKDYPDLRWDLNNGITVCVFCHEKIHSRKFPDWVTGRITETTDVVKIKPKIEFDITKHELQALYKSLSMKKIGDMYGVSDEIVRKRIHKFGIQTRSSGGIRKFNIKKDDLQALYNKNSMKKIAEILGVGETVIHKRIHEYGIKKQV